jgi:hypothetical protein
VLREINGALSRQTMHLRRRVARILVAVLVGTLFVPVGQMSVPALREQAAAAVNNGSIGLSSGGAGRISFATAIPSNEGLTLETWIRFTTIATANSIFASCANVASSDNCPTWFQETHLYYLDNGKFRIQMPGGPAWCEVTSSQSIRASQWIHFALVIPAQTVNQSTTVTVFVNGRAAATCTGTPSSTGLSYKGVVIGGSGNSATANQINIGPTRISKIARYSAAFSAPKTFPTTSDANIWAVTNTQFDSDNANSCIALSDPNSKTLTFTTFATYQLNNFMTTPTGGTRGGDGTANLTCSSSGPQADAITASGLILNLDANDENSISDTATTWKDLSGNGYDATFSASGAGNSIANETTTKAINIVNSSNTSQNPGASATISKAIPAGNWSGFTASFTANMGNTSNSKNVWSRVFDFSAAGFTQGSGAKGGIFISRFESSNTLSIAFWNLNNTAQGFCGADGIILNDTMTNYSVTVDSSGVCKWYRNNTLWKNYRFTNGTTQTNVNNGSTATNGGTVALPINVERTSLRIGRSHWNDTYFTGSIRNLAIYNITLTDAQRTATYNAQSSAYTDKTITPATLSSATITGTAQVGRQLTAVPGSITGGGVTPSYQWLRADTVGGTYGNIGSATSSTYTLVSADLGKFIKARITVTNSAGSDTKTSESTLEVAAFASLASASITGIAQVGRQLTAVPGAIDDTGTTTSYQWMRADTVGGTYGNISSATSETYTPVTADLDKFIKVRITVTSPRGSDNKTSEATLAVAVYAAVVANGSMQISSGGQQQINLGTTGFNPTAGATFEAWVNFSSIAASNQIFRAWTGTNATRSFDLTWSSAGVLSWYSAQSQTTCSIQTTAPVAGTWYNLALVINDYAASWSPNTSSVFLNGNLLRMCRENRNAAAGNIQGVQLGGSVGQAMRMSAVRISATARYGNKSYSNAQTTTHSTSTDSTVWALFNAVYDDSSANSCLTNSDPGTKSATLTTVSGSISCGSSSPASPTTPINGSISLSSGASIAIGRFNGGNITRVDDNFRYFQSAGWVWEGWIKFSTISNDYNSIVRMCTNGSNTIREGCNEIAAASWRGSDGAVNFNVCTNQTTGVTPAVNTWYHFAVSIAPSASGASSSNNHVYINGVRRASCTGTQSHNGGIEGFRLGGTTGTTMKFGPSRFRGGNYSSNFAPVITYPVNDGWYLLNAEHDNYDLCLRNNDSLNKIAPIGTVNGTSTCSTDAPPIPPAPSSLTVTTGPLAGGQSSVLRGTGLTGTTGITVGGNAATNLSVLSDTSVAFVTPSSGTPGAKDVMVTTPNGSATLTGGFTYLTAPTISSVQVTTGPRSGGTANRLTGTNLTGATEVKVGGVAAVFTVESSTTISFTTPISSVSGAVNVFVKTNSGEATRSNAFTYLGAALNPTFETATPTADGFRIKVTNYDSSFTWSLTSSRPGITPTIDGTGLITVAGLNPATASTVTVGTSRTGFESGTATSLLISSLTGQALVPTFGAETRTASGFQLQITNYNSGYTWSGTSSVQGGTPTINGSGLITVTGLNPGTASTVTVRAVRTGYETGTATSPVITSITGSALNPTFGVETRTATGFQLQITNYNSAYTWSGTSSVQGGSATISGTGRITVTGLNPGTASTVTIQATRAGYETGTATSPSISSLPGSALNPTFGVETRTATGFQLQITNYNSAYTWSGTSSAQGGSATVNSTGLITVTGINPGTASTVTIQTTRTGYETGTATSSSISSQTGAAKTPTFGTATATADGFTLAITNYETATSWSVTNSLGKPAAINSATGLITVTGVNPGTASTVTVVTTRTGYETGTATSSSISSLRGAAKTPTFGEATATADGFTLPITNYETATTWSVTNSLGKSAAINSATGLITVTGVSSGTASRVTVVTTRTGYETGTATSDAISSATLATQPTNVAATTAARSARVTWSAPASTGGVAITDYTIEYSSTGGETWTAFSHAPSTATEITVTGLTDATLYLYRVAAVNAAGQSSFSTSSAVRTSYFVSCSTSGSFFVSSQTIPSAAGVACKGTVTIPQGITGVATNAFAPNTSATGTNRDLTAIVFPATGFVDIGLGGFMNLGLTTVTIPASVTSVGQYGFQNNPLTSVTITGGSGGASTLLKDSVFGNATAEYGLTTQIALTLGSGKIDLAQNFGSNTKFSAVDFGPSLNSIALNAFKKNSIVAGWIPVFSPTITSISAGAFTENPRMRTIRFGSETTTSIQTIDENAFDKNYLKSVQYCGPRGNANELSKYLAAWQTNAKIWCDFIAPNAPTISTTSQSNQQVSIGWTMGSDNNEPPTDTFTIQYRTGGGSWITVAYDATTPLSSVIGSLTNGTAYSFRVAANNIAGASPFSSEVQVTPLGLGLVPLFDTVTATASGFTFNVINYSAQSTWSGSVSAGTGTVTLGTPNGLILPVTVSGMAAGATSSVLVSTSRSTFDTGTATTAGTSLNAALTPTFGTASVTTNGYTVPITNYNSDYTWSVLPSSGSAQIVDGAVRVTGVAFATLVNSTVTAARVGAATGSQIFSATTLAGLTATYYGNGNTGGLVPSETSTYQTNGTVVVLGNSGELTKPGYTFSGWNLNSANTGPTYQAGDSFSLANAGSLFLCKMGCYPLLRDLLRCGKDRWRSTS